MLWNPNYHLPVTKALQTMRSFTQAGLLMLCILNTKNGESQNTIWSSVLPYKSTQVMFGRTFSLWSSKGSWKLTMLCNIRLLFLCSSLSFLLHLNLVHITWNLVIILQPADWLAAVLSRLPTFCEALIIRCLLAATLPLTQAKSAVGAACWGDCHLFQWRYWKASATVCPFMCAWLQC